jgi:hypothetical protein
LSRAKPLIPDAVLATAFERALRICIWNECKASNMVDAAAYRIIEQRIEAVRTNAIAEWRGDQ